MTDQPENNDMIALTNEMFEVFKAGWLGAVVWDAVENHKKFTAESMPSDDIVAVSFDAYLASLVEEIDVIGKQQPN